MIVSYLMISFVCYLCALNDINDFHPFDDMIIILLSPIMVFGALILNLTDQMIYAINYIKYKMKGDNDGEF